MADALIKWEPIDKDQIDDLMAGNKPRPPLDDHKSASKTT
jgi:cell division protease FtsH